MAINFVHAGDYFSTLKWEKMSLASSLGERSWRVNRDYRKWMVLDYLAWLFCFQFLNFWFHRAVVFRRKEGRKMSFVKAWYLILLNVNVVKRIHLWDMTFYFSSTSQDRICRHLSIPSDHYILIFRSSSLDSSFSSSCAAATGTYISPTILGGIFSVLSLFYSSRSAWLLAAWELFVGTCTRLRLSTAHFLW